MISCTRLALKANPKRGTAPTRISIIIKIISLLSLSHDIIIFHSLSLNKVIEDKTYNIHKDRKQKDYQKNFRLNTIDNTKHNWARRNQSKHNNHNKMPKPIHNFSAQLINDFIFLNVPRWMFIIIWQLIIFLAWGVSIIV